MPPTPSRDLTPLESITRRIESSALLDTPGKAVGRAVRSLLVPGRAKDALSGIWLGHAVHPMLTDVVIGSFMSASLLDLISGEGSAGASERLIGLGIAAYAPTALTGLSDWADSESDDERVRRAGIVHAGTNALALGLYCASLVSRRRGARARGVLLGAAGASALSAGAYLGGHLTLRRGVAASQTGSDRGPTG